MELPTDIIIKSINHRLLYVYWHLSAQHPRPIAGERPTQGAWLHGGPAWISSCGPGEHGYFRRATPEATPEPTAQHGEPTAACVPAWSAIMP